MHAKKVLIPFLLLLALVPLCACTATVPTPGVPLPQLVIGSDNYPPYNYTDENGFPAGVDVSLARDACSRQVVAVRQDSDIQSLGDLAGHRVAVQISSKPEEIFSAGTDPRLPTVSNIYCLLRMEDVVSALRKDYVDACAGHAAALTAQLQYTNTPYRLLEESLLRSEVGVAFALEGDTALRDRLHTALVEMFADGTIEKILAEYGLDPADALGGTAGE